MDPVEMALFEKRVRISTQAKRMIYVTLQKEGIHCYPAAATDINLKTENEYDVSFLSHPHRHIFHFNVSIQVFHNDRDIEFIQFKRWLENLYKEGTLELNHKSCEMMSDDVYEQISRRYPNRYIVITVSEDNENGATIHYNVSRPLHYVSI